MKKSVNNWKFIFANSLLVVQNLKMALKFISALI